MKKKLTALCAVSLVVPFFLGGCTMAMLDTATHGIFQDQEVNIAEKNYAAADYLVHQAQSFIQEQTIIKAGPLGEEYEPNITSRIGQLIPEQIGIRFSQLGYNVDLSEVMDDQQPANIGPLDKSHDRDRFIGRTPSTILLNGTYLRTGLDLQISVRMIDTGSGRVVAAFDYTLPMTNEIADLSEPRPRIYKVTK